LIAVDKDFRVLKINILGHAETPGLGDEIETDGFKNRFAGKDAGHLKVLRTETTEYVQAISGATISSRAVAEDAVKNGVEFLKKTLQEKGEGSVTDRHS
jgi:electron transport complex protein RnfG